MDHEFNCLGKLITGTDLNTMAARYHKPEIYIQIQVVKEYMGAVHGGLPYDRMTNRIIIEIVKYVVIMINDFPLKSGISHTYNQHTIITGKKLDFKK